MTNKTDLTKEELQTKIITDFLSSEAESSRNNSSRKNCLREINDLFKKKQKK